MVDAVFEAVYANCKVCAGWDLSALGERGRSRAALYQISCFVANWITKTGLNFKIAAFMFRAVGTYEYIKYELKREGNLQKYLDM